MNLLIRQYFRLAQLSLMAGQTEDTWTAKSGGFWHFVPE
jgi:hypothetical protein